MCPHDSYRDAEDCAHCMDGYPPGSLGAIRADLDARMDSALADMSTTLRGRIAAWFYRRHWAKQQAALDAKLATHRNRVFRDMMGYELPDYP